MTSHVSAEDLTEPLPLGTVWLDQTPITLTRAYGLDEAYLSLEVPGPEGEPVYFTLIANTFPGFDEMTLDVLTDAERSAVWIRTTAPDNEVIGHFVPGSTTAMTPFGEKAALPDPYPETISGGAPSYPDPGDGARPLATFHLYPLDSR